MVLVAGNPAFFSNLRFFPPQAPGSGIRGVGVGRIRSGKGVPDGNGLRAGQIRLNAYNRDESALATDLLASWILRFTARKFVQSFELAGHQIELVVWNYPIRWSCAGFIDGQPIIPETHLFTEAEAKSFVHVLAHAVVNLKRNCSNCADWREVEPEGVSR